jgi:hypothetical protein
MEAALRGIEDASMRQHRERMTATEVLNGPAFTTGCPLDGWE